jgi:hypothetical protein
MESAAPTRERRDEGPGVHRHDSALRAQGPDALRTRIFLGAAGCGSLPPTLKVGGHRLSRAAAHVVRGLFDPGPHGASLQRWRRDFPSGATLGPKLDHRSLGLRGIRRSDAGPQYMLSMCRWERRIPYALKALRLTGRSSPLTRSGIHRPRHLLEKRSVVRHVQVLLRGTGSIETRGEIHPRYVEDWPWPLKVPEAPPRSTSSSRSWGRRVRGASCVFDMRPGRFSEVVSWLGGDGASKFLETPDMIRFTHEEVGLYIIGL